MRGLKVRLVLAAAVATFSTAGLGLGSASAQDMPLVCDEGQIQVITYECSRTPPHPCRIVSIGCE